MKKLVYISSTSAIPELPKGAAIKEGRPFRAAKLVEGFYAKTKAEATQIVLDAVRSRGLDASVVFPTGLCGPEDYAKGRASDAAFDRFRPGKAAGRGQRRV